MLLAQVVREILKKTIGGHNALPILNRVKDNITIVILGVKLENEREMPTILHRLGNPSQSCMY